MVLEAKAKLSLIGLNQQLLDSIVNLDYDTYNKLCADDISCMEPESDQNVVIGKAFHKFYFDAFGGSAVAQEDKSVPKTHINVTMVRPHVQWIGSGNGIPPAGAILSYVKLTQQKEEHKAPITIQQSETRVWEFRSGEWLNVHFHKSPHRT